MLDENDEDDDVRLMVAVMMMIIFYLSLNHKSTISALVGRMPLMPDTLYANSLFRASSDISVSPNYLSSD